MCFPCQGTFVLKYFFGRTFPCLSAVEQQVQKPGAAVLGESVYFKILFPEFIEASKVCFFAQLFYISVPGKQIIVIVIIFFFFFPQSRPLLRCGKNIPVGKIHKGCGNSQLPGCFQGNKFRGIVQKWIITFIMLFFFRKLSRFVVVRIVNGKGGLRIPVHHNRYQFVGIFRPFY